MFFTLILSLCASSTIAFATPTSSTNTPLRTVLVTGGAGYIGSHTCLELLNAGNYRVVVIDTLDNSSEESLNRVQKLTGCHPDMLHYRNCDIRDRDGLCKGEYYAIMNALCSRHILSMNDTLHSLSHSFIILRAQLTPCDVIWPLS